MMVHMAITVKFIGAFRSISGKSKLSIRVKDAVPLSKVIKKIIDEQPKIKRALIDSELEDPRPNTLILVNGKEISVLNGLNTMIKNGDEVIFVPVVHGG
jgi:molybdopterin synthase sulfur carrier subunit